jgi:hypothetical protein
MARKGFLISQIQQKQKKLEYWRKGYLKALEEIKNARQVLQEVIKQSELILSETRIEKENDISSTPPLPKKTISSNDNRTNFNQELNKTIRPGVKPSDLKPKKDKSLPNGIVLSNVSVKKMKDAISSKDYFVITEEKDALSALKSDYKPIDYLCIEEEMKFG